MEGIFGDIPPLKALSSEITKYEIFLLQDDIKTEDLDSCRIKCLALVTSLTKGYIWHNEGFNLSIKESDGIQCLVGATDFGDFIEDEWLIVWLLHEITKGIENVAARIKDADGEFLLIEAANDLPKWLNVDTCGNRVFIRGGHIHIIKQPQTPGEIARLPVGKPTLRCALESIRFHAGLTRAHASIEECIRKRISKFPEDLHRFVQNVDAYLPENIVRILDEEPGLVSAAVRAFYLRDPIDLRACRVFKDFVPDSRVWTQIPMNRCSYAQLMQQVFKADKRSGYAMPKDCGSDFKGMDIGCKIAHGFEILCASCRNSRDDEKSVFDEQGFQNYVAALKKRDYFCGEIEGSKKHNQLMSNARAYFIKFSSESIENNYKSISNSAGGRILAAKNRLNDNFHEHASRLPIKTSRSMLPVEDSDEWMYLDDEKMDDMLSEMKLGFQNLGKAKLDHKSEENDLVDLTGKMKAFITNLSDYEGIESRGNQTGVDFDPAKFENALKKLCGMPAESNDSGSDDFLSSEEETDDEEASAAAGISDVMEQMDAELASTNIGESFFKEADAQNKTTGSKENFVPVDIDLNLVQNFLKSCESETEMPGAATTLLQSIGLDSHDVQTS